MTKLCKDCKYFKDNIFCQHPINGKDFVHGGIKKEFAAAMRSEFKIENCGEAGIYWTEKEQPKPKLKWWEYSLGQFK